MSPLLEVQGLVKQFGGNRAVDGATFTVEAGSITGLIGPNGGKIGPLSFGWGLLPAALFAMGGRRSRW